MSTRIPPTASVTKLETFYTVKQAARKLIPVDTDEPNDESSEAGERWLRDGVNHKDWPHHRFGKRLMFSESDLAQIAALNRSTSTRAARPRRASRRPARAAA